MFKNLLNRYDIAERELIVWKRERKAEFKERQLEEERSFGVETERNNRELALQEEKIETARFETDLIIKDIERARNRRREVVELERKLATVKVEAEREKYIGIIAAKDSTIEILQNQLQVVTATFLSKLPDVNLTDIFKNLNINVKVKVPKEKE